jgi:hemolysin activation/secretion protein
MVGLGGKPVRRRYPNYKIARLVRCLAIASVLSAAAAAAADAQTPGAPSAPPFPGSNPSGTPPLGSPLPGIAAPPPLKLAPGLPRPPQPVPPGPSAAGEAVTIDRVVIDGATAFPEPAIVNLTGNLTGPSVAISRIEASRRALVDLYRANGYVYTTVRAIIQGPELRFQVVEGYIADVKLDGDVGPAGNQVLRFLRNLINQRPLRTTALERWLLLASDIPGLTIRSTLNPSTSDPGVLTLVAQVSRKPVSGYLTADNRAFNLTGPEQGLAVVNLDSFTSLGERSQFSLFRAFDGTNVFGQASEEFYIGGSGLKMKLYAGIGRSTPSGELQINGYVGDTRVLGTMLTYPLYRTREQSFNLVGQFDAIESDVSDALGPGGTNLRVSYDSLRVMRFGFDYAFLDNALGTSRGAVSSVIVRFSHGLQALGAGRNGDTTTPPARLGDKIDFSKVSGELVRTQTLLEPMPDLSVALRGALGWQLSGEVLPSAEKFYLGGPRFNRGFYYGQVSGDDAATLSAELQVNVPPLPLPLGLSVRPQLYVFYDWGKAWQRTSAEADVTLQSAGTGVRFYVGDRTEIDLEGVYRMNRYPNGVNTSALPATAFYWQVLHRF